MKPRINAIIDSDLSNDVDDVFALTYALASPELNIELVSLAPFSANFKRGSFKNSMVDSELEAKRVFMQFGRKDFSIIKRGCTEFLPAEGSITSPAAEEIIRIAKKNRKTTFIAISPLTNLASALLAEPKIAKKLDVVFLGTQHIFNDNFADFNYSKDKRAFEIVVKSGVNLTIIPSPIARQIVTSTYEARAHLCVNKVGRYLYRTLKNSEFLITSRGIKIVQDVAAIAYVLNKSWFKSKIIPANDVLKEQQKIDKKQTVNYVYEIDGRLEIWLDFIARIEALELQARPHIFFTSDTHFSSKRKLNFTLTPFDSVEQMDYELVKRWNSVVGKNDTVYHIGDFGDYEFVKQLNGNVVLIMGNYEERDAGRHFEQFREKLINLGFKDVIKGGLELDTPLLKKPVYLTHKPSKCKKDRINLFGHIHELSPIKKAGFNVCCNYNNFAPFGEKEINHYLTFLDHGDKEVFMQ